MVPGRGIFIQSGCLAHSDQKQKPKVEIDGVTGLLREC